MKIDTTRPWSNTGLTSASWLYKPVLPFYIPDLILTQDGVYFEALFNEKEVTIGGDVYPHVVIWKDEYYLEDGHTRLLRAMLRGQEYLVCRYWTADTTSTTVHAESATALQEEK